MLLKLPLGLSVTPVGTTLPDLWSHRRFTAPPVRRLGHRSWPLRASNQNTGILQPTRFANMSTAETFFKEKVKVKSLSRIRLFATPWTVAHEAPPSTGVSRQEYWSGLPFQKKALNDVTSKCHWETCWILASKWRYFLNKAEKFKH